MTWDNAAKNLTAKVITRVESGLRYDAINYRDPITVGAFQWYGTRAAAVLRRMRTENAAAWTGVAATINSALDSHSDSDSWWNGRYLSTSEGNSLKPVLFNNKAIQHNQALIDFEAYKNAYVRYGGNADANTQAMIFWMTMWHQSPVNAATVLRNAGATANIDRLYSYCINNSVFDGHISRYSEARTLIKAGDSSGINLFGAGSGTPDPIDPLDPGGDATPAEGQVIQANLNYIRKHGNELQLVMNDGSVLIAYPRQANYWAFKSEKVTGYPLQPGEIPPADDTPPVTGTTPGDKALAWMMANQGRWAYGQGPGRLDPFTSGYGDCSSITYLAYKQAANILIGTYTTPQSSFGTLITNDRESIRNGVGMLPGDLIFYRSSSSSNPNPWDHVEMYTGNALKQTIGQAGSKDPGPTLSAMNTYLNWANLAVMARRPW